MKLKNCLFIPLAVLASTMSHGQDTTTTLANPKAASTDSLLLIWENDTFASTDKWYTNGVMVNWTLADVRTWDVPTDSEAWLSHSFSPKLPDWAQAMVTLLPFSEDYENNTYRLSFSIGQNMYAPANIKIAAPQPNDRPWAGWLYINPAFSVRGENRMDVFELSLGVVGPWSGAEEAQKRVHEIIDSTAPAGWDNQLSNEFAFVLSWQRYWRYALTEELDDTFGADFVGNVGFSAGNVYVFGEAGFMFRFGYNIPQDFGTSLIGPAGTYGTPIDDDDPRLADDFEFSVYGFAGTEQRIIGRNIFLDGNTFANSASIDKHVWVGDFRAGVGASLGPVYASFSMDWRTNEFIGESGGQWFGSVNLGVVF